jgi:hypothetical protein
MGTNFYRIPSETEMASRLERLQSRVSGLDMSPAEIGQGFATIDDESCDWSTLTPWDEFVEGTRVHLGKRSGGWRFTWNFHNGRYYSNRQELFDFIRSGRVVDEYGTPRDPSEFIEMALGWCPDGDVFDADYVRRTYPGRSILYTADHYSREEEGLVISGSTEFS